MVRKAAVSRPHAGNENRKFRKENKLRGKKNEGWGSYFISAMQQHFHLILVLGGMIAFLLNLYYDRNDKQKIQRNATVLVKKALLINSQKYNHVYQTSHFALTRHR